MSVGISVASAGAEINVGPSYNFCLGSPQLAQFSDTLASIVIGRFELSISIDATASASLLGGVHASASSKGTACIGCHVGVGAIASVNATLKGVWYITEPPKNAQLEFIKGLISWMYHYTPSDPKSYMSVPAISDAFNELQKRDM